MNGFAQYYCVLIVHATWDGITDFIPNMNKKKISNKNAQTSKI